MRETRNPSTPLLARGSHTPQTHSQPPRVAHRRPDTSAYLKAKGGSGPQGQGRKAGEEKHAARATSHRPHNSYMVSCWCFSTRPFSMKPGTFSPLSFYAPQVMVPL